ncbi:hypothetical protein KAW80_04645 [Candidatus Babeliales bacterium]|nr:hypothetical protein [Candidatus Babeliales bacterium]
MVPNKFFSVFLSLSLLYSTNIKAFNSPNTFRNEEVGSGFNRGTLLGLAVAGASVSLASYLNLYKFYTLYQINNNLRQ